MRIDLSRDGLLTPEQAKRLNEVADRTRVHYNDMISRMAIGKEDDLDWWVSGIAGRNTYVCSLFVECCHVVLIRDLLADQDIAEIVTASRPLAKTIRSVCRAQGAAVRVVAKESFFEPLKILWKSAWDCGRDMAQQIYRFWLCRIRFPSRKGPLPANCTLVELFVLDGSFAAGDFQDRYYENFGGCLRQEEEKDHVYLANLAVRFKNLAGTVERLRAATKRFLIQEEILQTSDFVHAWSYPLRCWPLFPRRALLSGIDVTPLLRRAWLKHLFSSRSLEAILKFGLVKRLKKSGATLRLVIDWFENQDMDKAFNMALRRYFPETAVVGYQGFDTQKYFLCAYPTEVERRSGVLPHSLAVCGPALMEERRQFCRDLPVETAPAFRYMNVWRGETRKTEAPFFRVLIILPLEAQSAMEILRLLLEAIEAGPGERVRFFLKPHPAMRLESIYGDVAHLTSLLKVVGGNISAYWNQTDLIMGNTSSALLEAAAMGIPVIVIGSRRGITTNPLPESLSGDIWRLAYTKEELLLSLDHFMTSAGKDQKRFAEIGGQIRDRYFSPVTRTAVLKLLRR